ncbi:unannotated protein [freshwater metagenome]|uniref:Unannotated protein n=1 Tax=freshwater metagenome TaxID=449393 RepID=A0A6J7L215_9ZZZZ
MRFAAARRFCAALSCLAVRARFVRSAFAPEPAERVRAWRASAFDVAWSRRTDAWAAR